MFTVPAYGLSWPFTSIGSASPVRLSLPKHAVGYPTTRPRMRKAFADKVMNEGEESDELAKR
jgi:hypothetical protein